MSGALGNLLIKLTADTGEATSDIGKAAHQIERDMQTMATRATAAGAAIGIAVAAIGAAFVKATRDAVMFGDQMAKLSQRTGMAVGRLSEIAFAGELADVSVSQLASGMAQFNKALVDADKDGSKAQRMFEALGVSVSEGPQVAFDQMAKAINTLPDGETKVAAMRAAFGKSGDAMIPLLSGLDEATDKARRLGITMSAEMAANSEKFNDSMTTLGVATSALVRNALAPAVSVLADMADQMVNAAAKGQLLTGVFMELGRWGAATIGGIAKIFGDDKVVDEAAAAFAQMRMNPEAAARSTTATPTVNEVALKTALAGTARKSGGRAAKDDNLLGRQLQEDMNEWAKIMAEAAAATDKYNQTIREQDAATMAAEVARAEAIIQMQELLDVQTLLTNGFDEQGRKIVETTQKTTDWAREMGLTFTSAFEDAIVKGMKFKDVLRGIAEDLLRMAARKLVTEPLGKAATSLFESLATAVFGGGKAAGGPVAGGTTYLVGERGPELFTPSMGGNITPNHAMGGGDTYYIDARGADAAKIMQLEQTIMALNGSVERRAVAAVSDARRRGRSV